MIGKVISRAMVLEQFLDRRIVLRHFSFVFILSAVYVFVAYAVQQFVFPDQSLATTLLLTILLLPSLHHVIVVEEKIESRGSSHFLRRHKTILKCYLGAFLGVLVGFLVLGFVNPDTLHYQVVQLEQDHLHQDIVASFAGQEYVPGITKVVSLFSHNIEYLLIGFVLSIFYGAGAIFLIVYNASFFAAFVVEIFSRWASPLLAGVSLTHMLPESAGFILTAMAGASLSRALIHEKLAGDAFRNVLRNDVKLLVLGILLVFFAAILEVYVTAPVFHSLI
ncbi:Stage II sporulation protein M [uncultured archaeon]|nr:Stage II sporulation protein M [uncultured archaeon]